MYEEVLKQANLTDNEITVYSLLLKEGAHTAANVSKKTALKRGNTYYLLDKLEEYGLIERYKEGKTTFFRIEHPQTLKEYVEQKQKELEQAEKRIDAVFPSLLSDFNLVSNKPGIYLFEGKEGIIKAYDELLEDKLPIDSIEDKGEMAAFIPEYAKKFIATRIRKNITNRVVAPSTNPINKTSAEQKRETRFVDVKLFPFEMDIKITDRKVVMTTFKEKTAIGVIMIHPEIVKNYKILFEFLWHTAGVLATTKKG